MKKIIILIYFLIPFTVFAGSPIFKIDTPQKASGVYKIEILINTENEEYNAIEGDFFYDKDLIDVTNIITADSIVAAWLINPKAVSGNVKFSGVIPNGYKGSSGNIFSIYATAKNEGKVKIAFQGKAYLNDGLGTIKNISLLEDEFSVVKFDKPEVLSELTEDAISPIILQSAISQNEMMYEGAPFLIVHAKDGESGVANYEFALSDNELKEEEIPVSIDLVWQKFSSPTVLPEFFEEKFVYIRVTDQSGNVTTQLVSPPRQLSPESWGVWLKEWWGLGIIVILVLGLIWLALRRHLHASSTSL